MDSKVCSHVAKTNRGPRHCTAVSSYTVSNSLETRRVCGKHLTIGAQQMSRPGEQTVAVTPDFYITE